MKLLLDTQVMKAWLTGATDRLSAETIALLQDPQNERYYSTASIWELSLKEGMGASNVKLNPHQVVTELKEQGFIELSLRAATLWRAFRPSRPTATSRQQEQDGGTDLDSVVRSRHI